MITITVFAESNEVIRATLTAGFRRTSNHFGQTCQSKIHGNLDAAREVSKLSKKFKFWLKLCNWRLFNL